MDGRKEGKTKRLRNYSVRPLYRMTDTNSFLVKQNEEQQISTGTVEKVPLQNTSQTVHDTSIVNVPCASASVWNTLPEGLQWGTDTERNQWDQTIKEQVR